MASRNLVILVGEVSKKPVVLQLNEGTSKVAFEMTTTTRFGKKEQIEHHKIVCFGDVAAGHVQHLRESQDVSVEGRLQTKTWKDERGKNCSATEVVALVIN